MTNGVRGRPKGTTKGFSLQGSKWRVAFAIYSLLIAYEMSKKKATALSFAIMINPYKSDARKMLPPLVAKQADGMLHFKLQGNKGRLLNDALRRFEYPMASDRAAWLTLTDFSREIKRLDKAAKGMSEEDAAWLCLACGYLMIAVFGVDDDIKADGWFQMRQISGDAILPIWQPLAASEPPYIRTARLVAKQYNAAKAARSN
jgi:hypothetical protein